LNKTLINSNNLITILTFVLYNLTKYNLFLKDYNFGKNVNKAYVTTCKHLTIEYFYSYTYKCVNKILIIKYQIGLWNGTVDTLVTQRKPH